MTQGSLFSFDPKRGLDVPVGSLTPSPADHLARVSEQIAAIIKDFLVMVGKRPCPEFHMAELLAYVARCVQTAPDSPGRILRDLRQRGEVVYVVVDRAASRYRVGE